MTRYVILGGGISGMTAAEEIIRIHHVRWQEIIRDAPVSS